MVVYAALPEAAGLSTPTPSALPMAGVYLLTAGGGRLEPPLPAVTSLSGLAVLGDDELGEFFDGALGDRFVVLYAAVSEGVDPVADVEDLGVVVDYQDHGYAPFILEALDEVQDQGPLLRPHRRERLVQKQHLRVRLHCACDGYGLALPARKSRHLGVYGRDVDAHVFEVVGGLLFHLAVVEERSDGHLAIQEHVVEDRELVDEREVLVDGLDAQRARLGDGTEVDLVAFKQNPALVRAVEAGDGLEQGALARPVVPDKAEYFSFPDVQVNALEDGDRTEVLDDALYTQEVRAVRGAVLHHAPPAPRNFAT